MAHKTAGDLLQQLEEAFADVKCPQWDHPCKLFDDDCVHRVENFRPLAPDVEDMVKYLTEVVADLRRHELLRHRPPRHGE